MNSAERAAMLNELDCQDAAALGSERGLGRVCRQREALVRCEGEKQRGPHYQLGAGNSSRNGELN